MNSSTIELSDRTLRFGARAHNRAMPAEIEKLRSKGVAIHVYSISVYYAYSTENETPSQTKQSPVRYVLIILFNCNYDNILLLDCCIFLFDSAIERLTS